MPKRPKKSSYVQGSNSVSMVLSPWLYLGPCSAASSKTFLTANAITHVLSVGTTPSEKYDGIIYHRLSLKDASFSSTTKVIEVSCTILDDISKKLKGKVLVHCVAGISRSPTLVVAYLMKCHNMTLESALGRVVIVRPQASPNPGFLEQLKRLDVELFGSCSLDVGELPKREKDRLTLFKDHPFANTKEDEERSVISIPGGKLNGGLDST